MTTHELKIKSEYFVDVELGFKLAEIRYNDRNYKVGDFLVLHEIDEHGNRTGNQCSAIISHILDDEKYLRDGYVMLSIGVMSSFVLNEEANDEKTTKNN